MRITVLCPHLRIAGGVRAILAYADRLARRDHAVTVVVPAGGWLAARRCRARHEGPSWVGDFRAGVQWVSRWRAGGLPAGDAVVATAWQSAPVVAAAPARCGRKFYLVQHDESLYHGAPDRVNATYRLPLTKIVISTWLGDVMREKSGSGDVHLLVTPVDGALFRPVAAERSGLRVLMLHHDYAWKGVADGLAAVDGARAGGAAFRLVGFGVKAPRGTTPYDEFHENPPQEALAALYSGADVYLCPSWDEGLGMPAMEAMACGAMLVTYDNGGCRDYARDGETALVARHRDVGDLTARLTRALTDEPLRRCLADAGRAFVASAFDWDRAVARLEALLAGHTVSNTGH